MEQAIDIWLASSSNNERAAKGATAVINEMKIILYLVISSGRHLLRGIQEIIGEFIRGIKATRSL